MIRPILNYPNKTLSTPCQDVIHFDNTIKDLVDDMFETMYHDGGIGLAANQIGLTFRIFVMDISGTGLNKKVYINPVILTSRDEQKCKEGCLSFPGVQALVNRNHHIVINAQDLNGNYITETLKGIEAVCFQHELDHLNGITFFDHLSKLQQSRLTKKLEKLNKKK